VFVIATNPPKHAGIVTRRPLVLQLHKVDENREWAEFMHLPRKRFTDFGMFHLVCHDTLLFLRVHRSCAVVQTFLPLS